jgi:hypothetical protein
MEFVTNSVTVPKAKESQISDSTSDELQEEVSEAIFSRSLSTTHFIFASATHHNGTADPRMRSRGCRRRYGESKCVVAPWLCGEQGEKLRLLLSRGAKELNTAVSLRPDTFRGEVIRAEGRVVDGAVKEWRCKFRATVHHSALIEDLLCLIHSLC